MRTFNQSYDPRRNSLNCLRLILALGVVFSHALTLGALGSEVIGNKTTFGTIAVYGFFGISGYLIAGSAARHGVGRYLWQRFLRIFPAFWVCLLVTAFVFGLVAWSHDHQCGLTCYVRQPVGPWGYVFNNAWLKMRQLAIGSTLRTVPVPDVWNGSLWTLFYEFLCYLVLAILALVGMLRNRWTVAALGAFAWATEIVITSVPSFSAQFDLYHHWDEYKMLTFVPIFLTGSAMWLYRERLPDSGVLALGCVAAVLVGFALPVGTHEPGFALTSIDMVAPFLAYPLLWLGAHLPLQSVGATNDYSYGIYIYAWPVQQLLALWGVNRWGYVPYVLATVALTAPFAVASWWIVERHALRLKALGTKTPEVGPPAITGGLLGPTQTE